MKLKWAVQYSMSRDMVSPPSRIPKQTVHDNTNRTKLSGVGYGNAEKMLKEGGNLGERCIRRREANK